MRIHDFDFYQELYEARLGIHLTQDKSFLLDSRLTPIARKWNFPSLDSLTLYMRGMPEPEILNDVLAVMIDDETYFMRDELVFNDICFKILPYLRATRKSKPIRIWSAGCATGQEAWSLAAMVMESPVTFRADRISILGTDLSANAIEHAKAGIYTQHDIQRNLPAPLMTSYFIADGQNWSASPSLRSITEFKVLNLMDEPRMRHLGKFDIICCRYIMKDISQEAQIRLLSNILPHLNPDGFLILGEGESPPAIMNMPTNLHAINGLNHVFGLEGAHESFMIQATA